MDPQKPRRKPHISPKASVAKQRKQLLEQRQRATVVDLLNSGASAERIVQVLAQGVTLDPRDMSSPDAKRFPMKRAAVRRFISELQQERANELSGLKGVYKSEQVARLMADCLRMRSQPKPPWSAIARAEELLMRLLGTAEPERVQVSGQLAVREAIVASVYQLTDDELEALATEQALLEQGVGGELN